MTTTQDKLRQLFATKSTQDKLRQLFKEREADAQATLDAMESGIDVPPIFDNGVAPEISKPPTTRFRSIHCFVIGHPNLVYDYNKLKFIPSHQVPRDAILNFNNKPLVILYYTDVDDPNLPVAEGSIPRMEYSPTTLRGWWNLARGSRNRETIEGFRYLTSKYVYAKSISQDAKEIKDRFESSSATFIENVGKGVVSINPEEMGPYELGGHLSLAPVKRILSKVRHGELAKRLDHTMKWMIGMMVLGIIFAIIFVTAGGN